MTLARVIEAIRMAVRGNHDQDKANDMLDKALAALPDQPKSEAELVDIALEGWIGDDFHRAKAQVTRAVRALKAANVLYVKEG